MHTGSFTNRATWRLNLAVEGHPTAWKAKAAFMKCATTKVPGVEQIAPLHRAVESFCRALAASGHLSTSGHDPQEFLEGVDWEELTDSWVSQQSKP